MLKVKATKTSKIQSVYQSFFKEFMKSFNNEFYCNLCSCTVSCNKRFRVKSHRNTSSHQIVLGSRSELLISLTLGTTLKSSNTNFVRKTFKAFLSRSIPLCKLNSKHIKILLHGIGHSLPSESKCSKTVLQLRADELQRIRNAVHDKKFLWLLVRTLFGTKYLNILVGGLDILYVSYLYVWQPLIYTPNSSSIAQAVDDAIKSLGIKKNSFCQVLSDAAK